MTPGQILQLALIAMQLGRSAVESIDLGDESITPELLDQLAQEGVAAQQTFGSLLAGMQAQQSDPQ